MKDYSPTHFNVHSNCEVSSSINQSFIELGAIVEQDECCKCDNCQHKEIKNT